MHESYTKVEQDFFFCLLIKTSSWSYLVRKTVGNTGGLSLILLWRFYLSIKFSDTATWKSQKPLITKHACEMKNIWLVCKKLQYSINFYSFSTTFLKFICISENGSLVSLFQECPTWLPWRNSRHVLVPLFIDVYFSSKENDVPFDCKTFDYLFPIWNGFCDHIRYLIRFLFCMLLLSFLNFIIDLCWYWCIFLVEIIRSIFNHFHGSCILVLLSLLTEIISLVCTNRINLLGPCRVLTDW